MRKKLRGLLAIPKSNLNVFRRGGEGVSSEVKKRSIIGYFGIAINETSQEW